MTRKSSANFPGGMKMKVRASRESDYCNCLCSMHSNDQHCIPEATKYLGAGMSSCSNRRTCGITEGLLHLSHHFPPPPLHLHMSPKVLPRASVISADHRLPSYPCDYILPWQEVNLAIKAPFHLCLLHLACLRTQNTC